MFKSISRWWRQPTTKTFRFVQVAERSDSRGKTAPYKTCCKDCGLSHRGVGLVIIRSGIRYVSCTCQESKTQNPQSLNCQHSSLSFSPTTRVSHSRHWRSHHLKKPLSYDRYPFPISSHTRSRCPSFKFNQVCKRISKRRFIGTLPWPT